MSVTYYTCAVLSAIPISSAVFTSTLGADSPVVAHPSNGTLSFTALMIPTFQTCCFEMLH